MRWAAQAVFAHGILAGFAQAEEFFARKTLFQWTDESSREDSEPQQSRIVTDRPHFSEASSLVGLGRVQLETGYSYFRDENSDTIQTHSFPEPLLRAGLFAEWFELRLGYNYIVQQTDTGVATNRIRGSDDLYVGAKLALMEQSAWLPEVAIFPQMRVPTGAPGISSEHLLPGFNLAYSWVVNDWLEIECNSQLNRRVDDFGRLYPEFIQTLNLEYELTERVGAFSEWIGFLPAGSSAAEPQHYLHGGFVFFVSDNVQLDLHSAVGLNDAADDLAFTGGGLSIRF